MGLGIGIIITVWALYEFIQWGGIKDDTKDTSSR